MDTKPRGDGGAQLPVDPPTDPPAKGDGKRKSRPAELTAYMVLWAPKPDEGDPIKWREVGWYHAHHANGAEQHARTDQDSGHYGAMLDAGKQRGVYLRAIAKRSWPDAVELHTVQQPPPEWMVGGVKEEG